MRKAVAHFGRALDYSGLQHQQHFGANSDDDEEMEADADEEDDVEDVTNLPAGLDIFS